MTAFGKQKHFWPGYDTNDKHLCFREYYSISQLMQIVIQSG